MIIGVILSLLALAAIGMPRLRRLNDKRAWAVYLCLFIITGIFTMRYMLGFTTLGPLEPALRFVKNTLRLTLDSLYASAQ